jgi:hypothetical protein
MYENVNKSIGINCSRDQTFWHSILELYLLQCTGNSLNLDYSVVLYVSFTGNSLNLDYSVVLYLNIFVFLLGLMVHNV